MRQFDFLAVSALHDIDLTVVLLCHYEICSGDGCHDIQPSLWMSTAYMAVKNVHVDEICEVGLFWEKEFVACVGIEPKAVSC